MKRQHFGVPFKARGKAPPEWVRSMVMGVGHCADGTICIASVPSDKKNDVMLGVKVEVWLYPDGTYSADMYRSCVDPGASRKGVPNIKARDLEDGCEFHPSCFKCPESDCILH